MALYMAKLHGRNRAYGIRKLRRSDDEAMARIERNLESAWANGMVEMHLEAGPELARRGSGDADAGQGSRAARRDRRGRAHGASRRTHVFRGPGVPRVRVSGRRAGFRPRDAW